MRRFVRWLSFGLRWCVWSRPPEAARVGEATRAERMMVTGISGAALAAQKQLAALSERYQSTAVGGPRSTAMAAGND